MQGPSGPLPEAAHTCPSLLQEVGRPWEFKLMGLTQVDGTQAGPTDLSPEKNAGSKQMEVFTRHPK